MNANAQQQRNLERLIYIALAFTTGARGNAIRKIKFEDITYVKEDGSYRLKTQDSKTM